MHGAAVTFAQQVLSSGNHYDLFIADDMMDVAVFSSLVRREGVDVPVCTYFHENQLSYPVSPVDTDVQRQRDQHYAYVNFTTALASDRVYFNSSYHMKGFLASLEVFLAGLPEGGQQALVPAIERKSEVLPLGMDFSSLEKYRWEEPVSREFPLILWNHRWEYDKGIGEFLDLLLDLHSAGIRFDVALLGERGRNPPERLAEVQKKLGGHVLANGMIRDFADYARWLWRADIAPVTAVQDFFGGSVVEAIYCDCHVVLPDRLAYPEHVTDNRGLYQDYPELLQTVTRLIESGDWRTKPDQRSGILQYDWANLAGRYDDAFSRCADREDL